MEHIETDLQRKIDALGLYVVDDMVYTEHLKVFEKIGFDVMHFTYYKWYGKRFVPYSKEYLISVTMEDLLRRDKEKYKQYTSSFFVRLKRKLDVWTLKGKVKSVGGLANWLQKHSKDEEG
ncbi:hypothetical protein [Bacillus toyonensis]|uniref:Uncharacterized protein n=1 Tax=Bacillus toyonensis TaxID=155322 RepID=A0A2A8H760_9BACI|nr:hypothetical protein [Bacillus toyonensis]PEP89764.1 hypothetical protein CN585_28440 [Bacillus toyonensis]